MTRRFYQNGMLTTGEPKHFNEWEFPSMPKLQRSDEQASRTASQKGQPIVFHKRGLSRLLMDVLRSA